MPTPPGYAKVAIKMLQGTMLREANITFGCDPTETDPVTIGESVHAAVIASGSLLSILDSGVNITGIRVSMGTDGSEDLVGEYPTSSTGARPLTTPPPNVAVLVHKVTSRGGRRGRGRMFLPWCITATNVAENGIINTTEQTVLQNAMAAFRIALAAEQVPMALLHQPSKPGIEHPTTPGAPNLVTSVQVDKLVSTQRRRLGR